jgi:hypothetical protein
LSTGRGWIVTVPFELIFSVLVGLVFSACARQQFSNGAAPWGRELIAILTFEAIVFWPVETYFYLVYPDWSWMYFVDPHRLPWGASVLVMLGYAATLLGGYLAGWAILRARKPNVLYGVLGGVAFLLAVFAIACRARMGLNGTFAEFHAGHALPVGAGKLGWALGVTTVGTMSAVALVGLTLREQGRRSRSE